MLGDLLLLSGNDIPFPGAQVTLHPPTIKEIAYIGEEAFFTGCGFLDFSKKILDNAGKDNLPDYNDFDIFIVIMNRQDPSTKQIVENALLVLDLIFPLYSIEVRIDAIILKQGQQEFQINKNNFTEFKEILRQVFNLSEKKDVDSEYNPQGDMAKRIAEKFKKRRETLAKLSGQQKADNDKNFSILSRYISILAIGLQKSINDLMQYTVYQLYDEFQRFQLKMQWDAYIQARMAGAKDLEEVDNWMIDLRDQGKNKNKNKK